MTTIIIHSVSGDTVRKYIYSDYEYEKLEYWGNKKPLSFEQIREAYYANIVANEAQDLMAYSFKPGSEEYEIAKRVEKAARDLYNTKYCYLSMAPDAIEELNSPP